MHDAFFANAADMLSGRDALRTIYADALDANSILATLNEMRARGLPDELYWKYLNEAKDIGLIPVAGRSIVGGRVITEQDILTRDMVLSPVEQKFRDNRYYYGIG